MSAGIWLCPFPGFSSFMFSPFSARLPLNGVKAVPGSFSLTVYQLRIPVEREHIFLNGSSKNPRAKILWLWLAQLGSHAHHWANPSGQNNSVLLWVRAGSLATSKTRTWPGPLEPQRSRGGGHFPREISRYENWAAWRLSRQNQGMSLEPPL